MISPSMFRDRQAKPETRAARRIALETYGSLMRLDDGPAGSQSEPGAVRLGRKKGLEDVVACLRRDASARVRDADLHRIFLGANAESHPWSTAVLHADVQRVLKQREEYVLH